jgi:DNA-binding CsgD family transcriptional regulator
VAEGERDHVAPDLQRGAIAVLDPDGIVSWVDEMWAADERETGLPRVPIGANLLDAYRGQDEPIAQTVASALAAVLEGRASYFEIEHRPDRRNGRSVLTSLAALRGDRAGVAVIHRVVSLRSVMAPRLLVVTTPSGEPIGDAIERLTPRERQVLDLMAAGLDNRAIAAQLRIEYTTVRGHVRSVIEKLRARSRLEAVARAYQSGWVAKH